jgi:hypothetical protein
LLFLAAVIRAATAVNPSAPASGSRITAGSW